MYVFVLHHYHEILSNVIANQDGNGRVTRALVSAILVRFGLLPLLVTVGDKDEYFRVLMAVSSPNVYIYHTDWTDVKADADGSNLLPLAKFIASRQLHAFFLCKTRQPPVKVQDCPVQSEFRRRRIEEAHLFIQQKASEISTAYKRTVNQTQFCPPSLTVVSTLSQISYSSFYSIQYSIWLTTISLKSSKQEGLIRSPNTGST